MKASDEVLLVHITDNVCQLSPSGEDPITMYKGIVLRKWKGHTFDSVTFSIPMGLVSFADNSRAFTSIPSFRALQNGGRYVVFLRFSQGEERRLMPALKLTGDAIQGAFALENERVSPVFWADSLSKIYRNAAVPKFVDEVKSLAQTQGVLRVDFTESPNTPKVTSFSEVRPEDLQATGLHLPSYVPTLWELMWYLSHVDFHQQLMVEWDSMPGRQDPIKKQDTVGTPVSGNFTVLERTQRLRGGCGKSIPDATELIVAAVTTQNEIRALQFSRDPRDWHGDYFGGAKPEGYQVVFPKARLILNLPDDPQIQTLVFLKPHRKDELDRTKGWRLETIGTLKLVTPGPTQINTKPPP